MYSCHACLFNSTKKSEYTRHIKTKKHLKNILIQPIPDNDLFKCEHCEMYYKSRQGLHTHMKKNHQHVVEQTKTDTNITDTDYKTMELKCKIKELELEEKRLQIEEAKLKQDELSNMKDDKMMNVITEVCNSQKMMSETIEKMGNVNSTVNNTTNNNNNTINNINHFNLNVFLNDKCKDAMNLMDFIKTLKYTAEDVDSVGRLGYAEAISQLFIKGLHEMDVTQRPIHCTDIKREKLYVKHDNEWKKDSDTDGNLKKAIKVVGQQNMGSLEEWKEKHPKHNNPKTKEHTEYLEICNQTMTGMLDDDNKEYKKFVKKIAPETLIDKTKSS
jgi:uncharacterized C2H2 Zn-finger protein